MSARLFQRRKYQTNSERQKAYRQRKKEKESITPAPGTGVTDAIELGRLRFKFIKSRA